MTSGSPHRSGGPDPCDGSRRSTELVEFAAGQDASLPLTWGQRRVADLQAALHPTHATLNVRFAETVREGASLAQIREAVRDTVERCASLRTHFRTDLTPQRQEVVSRGTVELAVVDLPRVDAAAAQRLADELAAAEFMPTDLPARFCVVSRAGQPAFLAVATSHLAADYFGAGWIQWHLREVLQRPFRRTYRAASASAHPADVSAWERSGAGSAAGRRCVDRHGATFVNMPATMLPRLPSTPATPRYQYFELRSVLAARSVHHLGARHGVSESAVLFGTFALLLGRVSGLSRAHLQVCVSNRSHGRFASAVAPITQDVPTWIDLAGLTLDSLLRRSAGVLLAAMVDGRFPPEEMELARRRAQEERGVPLDLSFWFNSRLGPQPEDPGPPDGDEAAALRARSTISDLGGDPTSTSTLFVYADRDGDALKLRIMVDTAYVTPDEARSWLRSVDDLLRIAATSAEQDLATLAAAAEMPEPVRGRDWALVDHSWVHLPTTAAAVRQALGSDDLRLEVVASSDAGADRIVAVLPEGLDLPRLTVSDVAESSKVVMLPHLVRHVPAGRSTTGEHR